MRFFLKRHAPVLGRDYGSYFRALFFQIVFIFSQLEIRLVFSISKFPGLRPMPPSAFAVRFGLRPPVMLASGRTGVVPAEEAAPRAMLFWVLCALWSFLDPLRFGFAGVSYVLVLLESRRICLLWHGYFDLDSLLLPSFRCPDLHITPHALGVG